MFIYFKGSRDKVMYLELAHGGHLGFYEGGFFFANPVTWLDRALVGIAGGLLMAHNKCSSKDSVVYSDHMASDDEKDLIKPSTLIYNDITDRILQKAS